MANSKNVFNDLVDKIRLNEPKDEIKSIVFLLMTTRTGLTKTEILAGKEIKDTVVDALEEIFVRINHSEPIQYILGEADFYGRTFTVTPDVLIPRPETGQIIDEALAFAARSASGNVLDIGTGSGCIAITLALEFPMMTVSATDISESALGVARNNALQNKATVNFLKHSVLSDPSVFEETDLLVSNPPYITPSEKTQMSDNVILYEPPGALFVPEEDPLIFYRAIANLSKTILSPGGRVIVEINERFGREVAALFTEAGMHNVVVKKDINSRERIVMASRS